VTEHDDELADLGGVAEVALVAVSVAMHVAEVALLHRSARRLKDRGPARTAAQVVLARLARRGDAALAARLERSLAGLGTERFEERLRTAARTAAARLRAAPLRQLVSLVGRKGANELVELGARACLSGGSLPAADVEALAAHLADGAELQVGLGRGAVFVRGEDPAHKVVEARVDALPDPRRASVVRARGIRLRGEAANATNVPASLIVRTHAGATEVRVSRDGRDVDGLLILEGVERRLRVVVHRTTLELEPVPQGATVEAARAVMKDWASIHAEVNRDPLLAELVGDLFGHPGFGGTADVLGALLELAPLIHRHEQVARDFVRDAPGTIQDPMAEIVHPLRGALEAAEAR
jgi:hypothetical protein